MVAEPTGNPITEPNYSYTPLLNPGRRIRLLSFTNTGDFDRIVAKLTAFDIQQTPPFIGLSYAWGPEQPKKAIRLDGHEHHVRANLFAAMKQIQLWRHKALKDPKKSKRDWTSYVGDVVSGTSLRRLDNDSTRFYMHSPQYWLYFWIDAVCIDQNNIEERNEQVKIMDKVYTEASFVLMWLGEEGDDGFGAVRAISSPQRRRELDANGWKHGSAMTAGEDHALSVFCRRPYWKRLWIVQEAILARDILVCCGQWTVDWNVLEEWYLSVSAKDAGMVHLTSAAGRLIEQKVSWATRRSYRSPILHSYNSRAARLNANINMPSLIMLADSFLFHECSDPRDRVYGLLGLVDDRHIAPLDIKIDYSMSCQQLHAQVVKALSDHVEARPAGFGYLGPEVQRFSRLLRIALHLKDVD